MTNYHISFALKEVRGECHVRHIAKQFVFILARVIRYLGTTTMKQIWGWSRFFTLEEEAFLFLNNMAVLLYQNNNNYHKGGTVPWVTLSSFALHLPHLLVSLFSLKECSFHLHWHFKVRWWLFVFYPACEFLQCSQECSWLPYQTVDASVSPRGHSHNGVTAEINISKFVIFFLSQTTKQLKTTLAIYWFVKEVQASSASDTYFFCFPSYIKKERCILFTL